MSTALFPNQTLPSFVVEGAPSSKSDVRDGDAEHAAIVIPFATVLVQRAMRAGLFYERKGDREIAVCPAWRHPEIIDVIRQFRGHIYSENGDVDAVRNGRNEHPDDPDSYHVLLAEIGLLRGCARYCRRNKTVQLGGWVIARELRGTRAALEIIRATNTLARSLGDTHFIAQASVEYGSASILRKLGGRVVAEYWEPAYQRNVETIEIVLPPIQQCCLKWDTRNS